jgi:AcrR family transcriptional regulator
MPDEARDEAAGSPPAAPKSRAVRADAQRSIDALLVAAKTVFATSGVDAPVREIADKAGVGIGTLYRNFPQRADLVAAVFRREIDACAEAAPQLAAEYPPGEALERWIQRYVAFIATKRGLASALYSGSPVFEALPAYFQQRLQPAFQSLVATAVAAGEIRAGLDCEALLGAIASLSSSRYQSSPEAAQRMVSLLIDGLRYGRTPSA